MPLAQLRTCAFNSRASFSSFGFFVSYLLREVLADEEKNQAEQCECLRHSSTDEEVAHELTLHLRLTSSRHAQAVGSNADTDARADCCEAIANDLQRSDCESEFNDYLL